MSDGWSGEKAYGSEPVDGGWKITTGDGGGTAAVLCFSPGVAFGLGSTYTHSASKRGGDMTASCNAGDILLNAGSGQNQLGEVSVFEPMREGDRPG